MAVQSNNQPPKTASVPAKRQPRKLDRGSTAPSRSESEAGGAPLPQSHTNNDKKPGATPRKRRPKKINSSDGSATAPSSIKQEGINIEVEALKSRVIGIEAQVQQLLQRPPAVKTPRRRLRQQKGVEAEPEPQVEMENLQSQLEAARSDLANLRSRAKEPETVYEEDTDVEEIPRVQGPGLERPSLKHVTLSGSYRIPLPTAVTECDLLAIQKGINSAQNVARTFLDNRAEDARALARSRSHDGSTRSSASWSEWFGGYSMSIARAVDNIQLSSRIETSPYNAQGTISPRRPAIGPSPSNTTPAAPRRKPPKLETRNSNASGQSSARRPLLKPSNSSTSSGSNRALSETQVAGLLA